MISWHMWLLCSSGLQCIKLSASVLGCRCRTASLGCTLVSPAGDSLLCPASGPRPMGVDCIGLPQHRLNCGCHCGHGSGVLSAGAVLPVGAFLSAGAKRRALHDMHGSVILPCLCPTPSSLHGMHGSILTPCLWRA